MEKYVGFLIIGLLVLVFFSSMIAIYNRIVFLKNNADKSFANIDVLLKQRVDEIPNLVTIVKQYSVYEQSVLARITKLRSEFLTSPNVDEKVKAANEMEKALKNIFVVSENYPDLKASQSFKQLQSRVSQIEDAISDRREFFNDAVSLYNVGIQAFPNVIFSRILGYKEKAFLQISDPETQYDGIKF